MSECIKYAIIYEIKKSEKYQKDYYHPCDVAIGYVGNDNYFYGKNRKYKIFPKTINDKFTVTVHDVEPLLLKSQFKKIDELLDAKLFESYNNYYQLEYSEEINEVMLKIVKNKNVIEECDKMFFDNQNIKNEEPQNDLQQIYQTLNKTVIGQEDTLKGVFANIVANKLLIERDLPKEKIKKMKSNIFINGATGTGKTFMIDEITKRLGIKYIKVDANDYTVAGYIGDDVNNIVYDLYNKCNKDLEQAETGIVIIDEIDKLACPNNEAEITTKAVQEALLTLMEGKEIVINRKTGENIIFDTSRLTVIVMGACAGIEEVAKKRIAPSTLGFGGNISAKEENKKITYETEDYVKYGFIPEFIGRFSIIYQTNDLEIEDFINIIKNSFASPYLLQKEKFALLGYDFNLNDEQIYEIAVAAKKLNTGARGIKKVIEQKCEDLLFSVIMGNPVTDKNDDNPKQMVLEKDKNYQF